MTNPLTEAQKRALRKIEDRRPIEDVSRSTYNDLIAKEWIELRVNLTDAGRQALRGEQ